MLLCKFSKKRYAKNVKRELIMDKIIIICDFSLIDVMNRKSHGSCWKKKYIIKPTLKYRRIDIICAIGNIREKVKSNIFKRIIELSVKKEKIFNKGIFSKKIKTILEQIGMNI